MRRGKISKNIIAFLILISVGFYIRGGQATAQPPILPPGLDIAIQVQEAHTPELLGDPEVFGTAVGLDDDGEPVIQVFTSSQGSSGIPNNIEGIPVEKIISGPFVALKGPPGGGGTSSGGGNKCDKDGDGVPGSNGKCFGPDCDDSNPAVHPAYNSIPAAPEICDCLDNDCDGGIDEGNPGGGVYCATGFSGVCGDGTTECVSCTLQCLQDTSASMEICDGLDNDCDGIVDEGCGPAPTPAPTPTFNPTPTPTPPAPTPTPPAPTPPPPTPTPAPGESPTSASTCNPDENRCQRPIPIGVSLGNEWLWCAVGTYGFRGIKDGEVVGVSNYHVLAIDLNGATISQGDAIMQPGLGDLWYCIDYIPNDRVGGLEDFAPITFCSCTDASCLKANSNVVDAAIFDPKYYNSTSIEKLDNATPADGYGTPKSNTISPEEALAVGGNVQKYGRTTGQTSGHIDSINATVDVQYPNGLCARFVNQIVITPGGFSAGGDSGSLIVMNGGPDDRRPVALLYAGDELGTFTVANPIDPVLTALGITIDGE